MNALKLIKESGVTQVSIARELGVAPAQLGNVLHGRRQFPTKWVVPICRMIGCSPNDLFEWEKEKYERRKTEWIRKR